MLCEKCKQREGRIYSYLYGKRDNNDVTIHGEIRLHLCDACVEYHRRKMRVWGSLGMVVGLPVATIIWLSLAPVSPIYGLFSSMNIVWLTLLSFVSLIIGNIGVIEFIKSYSPTWKIGGSLAEFIGTGPESPTKNMNHFIPSEPGLYDFQEALKQPNLRIQSAMGIEYLRLRGTESLKKIFQMIKSKDFDEAGIALWLLEIEIEKPEYGIDLSEIEKAYKKSMPFFASTISSYRLGMEWQYLDNNMVRVLHIMAKHADISLISPLSTLYQRIIKRRIIDGHIQAYINENGVEGPVNNESWHLVVKNTLNAITQRLKIDPVNLPDLPYSSQTQPIGELAKNPEHEKTLRKFCTLLQEHILIEPLTGQLICIESLPTKDACKQYNCIYHNATLMKIALLKSTLPLSTKDEEVIKSVGAVDFCK